MSDSADSPPPPSDSPPTSSRGRASTPRDRGSLVMAFVAVLAVTAFGLAGWAMLRSASGGSGSAPAYSDSQRADAKAQICAAFDTVRRGVARNTNLAVPGGEGDVAGTLAAAANARISLYDGGQYLLARLDPATPSPLADAVRGFANGLMDIGAAATAGALDSDPDQAARLRSAEEANVKVGQLCVE